MFRIEATQDIEAKGGVDTEDASINDLEKVIKDICFSDTISLILIIKINNEFVQLVHEKGTFTLTYGDGFKEFWTYHDDKSIVSEQEATAALRKFIKGEDFKAGIDWHFFQEQYTSYKKGCLSLIALGVLLSTFLSQI